MEDLRDETWIEGRHCDAALRAAAHAAGFEPRVAFDAGEWLGKQGLVLRSLGADGPRRNVLLATHARLSRAPAVEQMKAILRRVAQEHCFHL
jgi:hypothetical protein